MFCHRPIQDSATQTRPGSPSALLLVLTIFVGLSSLPARNSLLAQIDAVIVTTTSGNTIEGMIEVFDMDAITIKSGDKPTKVSRDQLSKIDFGVRSIQPDPPITLIQLMDGSLLNTKSLSIESRQLKMNLHCDAVLLADSRNVDSVRFKTYENQLELAKQWREILDDETRVSDAIVINRSQELGTVEGLVGDLSEEKLEFSIEDRTARVLLSKLDAILFYHASGREIAAPICEAILVDGSRLRLKNLAWKGSQLELTCACGTVAEVAVDKISTIRFSLGQEVFLSSVNPATNDWEPLMTSSAIVEKLRKMKLARVNQSFSGRPLSLKLSDEFGNSYLSDVKQFENGFAIQGGGKLAFTLNGQYEQLTGQVGFDPDANVSGNVLFKVILDGKIVLEKELINRFMKNPINLDIDVTEGSRLVIQVEYHDGRSSGDVLHLVNLKVAQ